MIEAWKQDYLAHLEAGNSHLLSDFRDEIEGHLEPYIRRMIACELLTHQEAGDLYGWAIERWVEVRDALAALDAAAVVAVSQRPRGGL
jgi:hypothetical protein